jgi:hypothetical protein
MQVGKKGLKTTGYQQTLQAENGPGRNFRWPGRSIGDYSSAAQSFFSRAATREAASPAYLPASNRGDQIEN